jgi:ParB family transcriptional regulator, chromosome partitioning protein
MSGYWQPTVTSYLGHVSKERILEAVQEGVSPDAAKRIAGMKKAAMAEAAAQLLAGRNWLPPLLRVTPKAKAFTPILSRPA